MFLAYALGWIAMPFIELGNAASIKTWHIYLSIHAFASLGNQLIQLNSLTTGTKQTLWVLTKMFTMKSNKEYKIHTHPFYQLYFQLQATEN